MTPEEVGTMLVQQGIDSESDIGLYAMKLRTRSDDEMAARNAMIPPPKRVPPPGKTIWDMIVGKIPYESEEDRKRTFELLERMS